MIWFGMGLLLIIWMVIYPVTDLYIRFIAPDVIRGGKSHESKVCLTFDDGPDPYYTPRVLQFLKEQKVPAVFFLVGAKVSLYPDLVRQIIAEGHEIGLHTFYHQHAYWLGWTKSYDTVVKNCCIIKETTGKTVIWFRPPWGAVNLFQFIIASQLKLKLVLWTANARDWRVRTGATGILRRLQRKVGDDAIIVLHDSGGQLKAPENTLLALPRFIRNAKEQGFIFATLKDMVGRRLK